jgi:hypothetical protein
VKFLATLLFCGAAQAASLHYWVQPCEPAERSPESRCRPGDSELAQWALAAWQAASDGRLTLEKTADLEAAHIRIYWATANQGLYGEARPILVKGVRGAEVYVLPGIVPAGESDTLLRDAIVYLTCLHETGHALGLSHTARFADIMYSFQYGGDITEYFNRYRRLLKARSDIRKHSGMSDEDRQRLGEVLGATPAKP